ncbi:MAG: DUF2555 domain-containing protein [Oscillatoriales cyanobacterium SM2_2_1]|nr:DUF2555 domain-containing protein [Oscillatoriales cyanobacterium SM2_2_1]
MEPNAELSIEFKEDLQKLGAEDVANIAERLEKDEYNNAFESLRDWHILRSLAFMGSSLVEPYQHLLDLEAFDEC